MPALFALRSGNRRVVRTAFLTPSAIVPVFRPRSLSNSHSVASIENRRQVLHTSSQRWQASDARPPASPLSASQAELLQPTKLKSRRSLRIYIYIAGFLLIGAAGGQFARAIVLPPPLPIPDSTEDEYLSSTIRKDIGKLPLVKELRANRDEWLEYEGYMDKPPLEAAASLTAGVMRGTRGLGPQRIFYNKKDRKVINVVFIGGALSGWPGVTHGGAVATLLHENMERAVNGPEFQQGKDGGDSSGGGKMVVHDIDITYRKPSHANGLFVIRVAVGGDSQPVQENGEKSTKVPVTASLESALGGFLCAEARGSCSASHAPRVSGSSRLGELPSTWTDLRHTISQLFG